MRPSLDVWALRLAWVVAQRATCLRRQVGCVLLNARGHVLATGYNGVTAGLPHCNEERWFYDGRDEATGIWHSVHPHTCPGADALSGTRLEECEAIHAEANALLQCHDVYQITTCYVTVSPCIHCVKLLLNTSCKKIVFSDEYTHSQAAELWQDAGRIWIKLG